MGLIKNIIKDYLVPPGYLKLIRKKEAVNMEAKFDNKLFEDNLKFKNLHQGERCFILASASLNLPLLLVIKYSSSMY